jgi:iduronate 2-sulfatase
VSVVRCSTSRLPRQRVPLAIYLIGLMMSSTALGLTSAGEGTANSRPNVLLICVDDLRPELGCYGVDYISSPNIDDLASRGCRFEQHYVQAPTCGASRFSLLTGTYGPAENDALFQRARRIEGQRESDDSGAGGTATLPEWFRQQGYATMSVGKVSHHPGGLGGPDWNDASIVELPGAWVRQPLTAGPWQHPRGLMHGLAHGEIRRQAQGMDLFQSEEGDDAIYPDGLIVDQSLVELERLAAAEEEQPFFLAVGLIRPHLPFGAPARYMEPYRDIQLPAIDHPEKPPGKTTWHESREFMKYNRWGRNPNQDAEFAEQVRKHYAACVSYADALVGRLLDRLDGLGLRDETIIILWGDHGWHLGEHSIWGKHSLFEESLHSPLIISYPAGVHQGNAAGAIVETIDIYPTLCELAGLPVPEFCQGTSLVPALEDPRVRIKEGAVSYQRNCATLRTATHRLIVHQDGHVELYDHDTPAGESHNIAADNTQLVETLTRQLRQRLPQ